jgi:hypothetical protein
MCWCVDVLIWRLVFRFKIWKIQKSALYFVQYAANIFQKPLKLTDDNTKTKKTIFREMFLTKGKT